MDFFRVFSIIEFIKKIKSQILHTRHCHTDVLFLINIHNSPKSCSSAVGAYEIWILFRKYVTVPSLVASPVIALLLQIQSVNSQTFLELIFHLKGN
jgi:hypothetical protein